MVPPTSSLGQFRSGHSLLLALSLALLTHSAVDVRAGTVELKSGYVLHGRPVKLQTMTRNPNINQGPVPIYSIVMVSTDWQRYYVPERQIPDHGLNLDLNLNKTEQFVVPQVKQSRSEIIQNVGSIVSSTPFDEQFGRRTVTLATARGNLPVIQGITRIAADHVEVTGLSHVWDYGIGLNSLPQETILSILQNPLVCKPQDPQDRLARARFYIAAEWYPQAFAELDSIARDFPDFQDRVTSFRQELLQVFGRHVMRELNQRRKVGQYQLADDSAARIPLALVGGAVQRDVEQFLGASQKEIEDLERVELVLGDLQAQLTDSVLREQVSTVRTQLLAELDRSGLDRLRPFLQSLNDPQRTAAEKLALAFSGWAAGADDASTDLPRSLRFWDARGLIREYLRSSNPIIRGQLFDELRQLESVGAVGTRELIRELPPVLDAEMIQPGIAAPITIPAEGNIPELSYQVLLPTEYSPNRRYPCIVALRAEHKTTEQMLAFWGGREESPGWAQRRGYIVIAPEYAPETAREYSYSNASHLTVLQTLRDAKLRFSIDADRVFLTGHDMGADAAFDIGMAYPDLFAGVMPIGGVSDHYGLFLFENCRYTAWYVVRGELGRDAQRKPMAKFFDDLFVAGFKYDLIYAEFPGRGQDAYMDELPKLFDWMDLHVRGPVPNEFEYFSLRQCDNQPFWVVANGLPKNYLLPQPAGAAQKIDVMKITGRVTPGNTVTVTSPTSSTTLRLLDGLVDFDSKLTVRINRKQQFSKFIAPDLQTMLEDYRLRADRSRLASLVLEF